MTQPPPENPYGNQDPNQPYGSQPPPPPPPPPYGAPQPGQPNAYGQVPYGGYVARDHPQAMLILILGILSLVLCSICGPFAWVMGNRALGEIDASGGQLGGRGTVQAGKILGIIATCLMVLGVVAIIGFVIIAVVAGTSTSP